MRSFTFGCGVRSRNDLHFVRHHKGGVESKTEFSDDVFRVGLILKLFNKFCRSWEGNLVYVFFDFIRGHTKTLIADCNGFFLFVEFYLNGEVAELSLEFPKGRKFFKLLRCIDCIGNQFPEKYLVVRIEEFLYDRKNVLRMDGDGTFFFRCHDKCRI